VDGNRGHHISFPDLGEIAINLLRFFLSI
jgi:hypothetical protein